MTDRAVTPPMRATIGLRGAAATGTASVSPDTGSPARHQPGPGVRAIAFWVVAVVVAVGVIPLTVRAVAFQVFYIPSPSMQPTLVENDRVLVNKLSYRFGSIGRDDVVVFDPPPGERRGVAHLIKRVVGLPGETVSLRDGQVLIDGNPVRDSHASGTTDPIELPQCRVSLDEPIRVPDGFVFVLGDNRNNSVDSRCFGPISEDLVLGRAIAVVWPLSSVAGL